VQCNRKSDDQARDGPTTTDLRRGAAADAELRCCRCLRFGQECGWCDSATGPGQEFGAAFCPWRRGCRRGAASPTPWEGSRSFSDSGCLVILSNSTPAILASHDGMELTW
jgi:hypothetical protein